MVQLGPLGLTPLAGRDYVATAFSNYSTDLCDVLASMCHKICGPMVSKMSMERKEAMALQMIRLAHFPVPIGQTPGHLSSAINLYAMSGARSDGSRYSVQTTLCRPHKWV